MRRKYCIYGLLFAAFGLGMLLSCLISSAFLRVVFSLAVLSLGVIIYFS